VNCSLYSYIGGGNTNLICISKYNSTISGGYNNTISAYYGNYSSILGGFQNKANGQFSSLVGGCGNTISDYAYYGFIGGGTQNCITSSSYWGVIGGGSSNCVNGSKNSILGGQLNYVDGSYSSILGGSDNIASGSYSSIVGGFSNFTNGCNCSFIVGSNISANSNCTTFVNNLNLFNTPTCDATQTQVLVRNLTSGLVNYRPANSIIGTAYIGSFYDTTIQTIVANTATPMKLNTTVSSETNGFSITNNGSGNPTRITATNTGIYNLQFSAQIDRTAGGGVDVIDIWIRKNGTDVAYSNTHVAMTSNNTYVVASWNYFVSLTAGQYVELYWAATSSNTRLVYDAATAIHPETPSLIATIQQI